MNTQTTLTIGQVFSTPSAAFRVKAVKALIIPLPIMKVGKKAITLTVTDRSKQEYNVKLGRNAYIKIDCFYKNHISPKQTTKTFKIGDVAEYGSYNLSYCGKITGITDKTITIVDFEGTQNEETHRMKIADFCWRNWNFDLEKVQKRNSEWCD